MPRRVKKRRSRCAGRKENVLAADTKTLQNDTQGKRSKSMCRARRNRTKRLRRRGFVLLNLAIVFD